MYACRIKLVVLLPLALFRGLLSLAVLLITWLCVQVLLIGAPSISPFESWREYMARGVIKTAGKIILLFGAVASLHAIVLCNCAECCDVTH